MKIIKHISFFCLLVSFTFIQAQVSLSQLKSAGINSEEDLKRLGVSEADIEKAKSDFFNKNNGDNSSASDEIVASEEAKEEIPEVEVKLQSEQVVEEEIIHGHSIFRNGSVTIKENSDRIQAPDDYIIGSGDKINVTIWGYSEFGGEFTIDELGNITPKLVGRINLKGKTFKTAKSILKSRFSKVYDLRNSQMEVGLSYSKVVSVNVVGEVEKPGSYSIPSVNSAFNFLALAGGPTETGSVRNIEIRRKGKLIKVLDVYTFMYSPESYKTQYLKDGDFLVVKPRKSLVTINGEVNKSGLFEFKEGETLLDYLKFAGGLTALADSNTISIESTIGENRQLNSYSFNAQKEKPAIIKSGDIINVLKISSLVYGKIKISGSVNVPGDYEFINGEKISDAITRAQGLNFESYTQRAHLVRLNRDLSKSLTSFNLAEVMKDKNNPKNLLLKEFDEIIVLNKDSFKLKNEIHITGMVKTPKVVEFQQGITVHDIILLSNGLRPEADRAKVEIQRIKFQNTDSSYVKLISINLDSSMDLELMPYDRISFRKLPEFEYQQTVTLKGQFKYPGVYTLSGKNDQLSDLIERAGGLTNWAFLEGATLTREENNLGNLLLNLASVVKSNKSKYNYILKPGDVINIPKTSDIVTISGAIGYKFVNKEENEINSPFHKSKRAGFYINKYGGGYDKGAKRKKVYVVSYNGLVKESRYFGLMKPKVKKGDKIIINYKEKKEKVKKEKQVDWNRVIENATVKLTGVVTLWILVNQAIN